MDKEIVIQIIGLVIAGLGTFLLGLVATGIKSLISTILETKTAMIVFKTEMKPLLNEIKKIPKLEKDINEFHAWKRTHTKHRSKKC